MPTSAVLYCRLSRPDGTDGESLSVDRQRQAGHELSQRLGWPIVAEYVDDGVSAWQPRKTRPQYRAMLRGIADGLYDAVIVYDHYRLHRQPWELEEFFTVCDRAGVTQMASYAGEYDLSSADGKFTLRIMGAVGAKESDDKSRRIRAALAQRAADGRPHGGPRPFGYQPGGMQIDEAEAEAFRGWVARLLAGDSLLSIARAANADGWRTTLGHEWSTRSMRLLLRNPRNAGWRVHKGERAGKAQWPPLIDEVTHHRVVRLFDDPSRRRPGPQGIHLLSGFVVCELCEQRMRTGYVKGRRRYACVVRPSWAGCGGITIAADATDDHVTDLVCDMVDSGALRDALAAAGETEGERQRLLDKLDEGESQLSNLAEDHHAGLLPRATYLSLAKSVKGQLDATRRGLQRLDAVPMVASLPDDGVALRPTWDAADMAWRRAVLGLFVADVVISPTTRRGNTVDVGRINPVFRV